MENNSIKELIATVIILFSIGSVIWGIENRSSSKKLEETTIDRTDSILMLTDKKIDEVVSTKEQNDLTIDSLKSKINDGKNKTKVEVANLKTQVESLARSEENWKNEANNLKSVPAEKKYFYEKKVVIDTIKVEIVEHIQVVDTVHVNDTTKFKQVLKNKFREVKK
jgi:hypothetical protein